MPTFVPAFLFSRHSFHTLRSFHLTSADELVEGRPTNTQAQVVGIPPNRSTCKEFGSQNHSNRLSPRGGIIPLSSATLLILAVILSFLFIISISCAFVGAGPEKLFFKKVLDDNTKINTGIVLVGENIDVDIDEPSITIRWSILACGDGFTIPSSLGSHGSASCGLPVSSLYIFVDRGKEPAATYDPVQIPFNREKGSRRSIQKLVQFDSEHVLDVHEARLYPFDTYFLSSTLRAVSFDNQTLPIHKLFTIDMTSNFLIETTDVGSYISLSNNTQEPSRDIDMRISRPGEARAFTLLLFGISWVLTHVTIGHVLIASMHTGVESILKHLLSAGAILLILPQLRNSMPDAPGLDGVLIDRIGYFPQMIISGISAVILLVLLVVREFNLVNHAAFPSNPAFE